MSYEGYVQILCNNGHRFGIDAYSDIDNCPYCGESIAFYNAVDVTNCDDYGIIPDVIWEKFLISPEKKEVCNLGHEHIVEQAVYRIPSKEEVESMRYYLADDGNYVSVNQD